MNEGVAILHNSKIQYLGTVGLDGRPRVRPFGFLSEHDGKLFYCTSNTSNVYKELQENPYVEISASHDLQWMRLKGITVFITDMDMKRFIYDESTVLKRYYDSAEDPKFEVFYIKDAIATITELGKGDSILSI